MGFEARGSNLYYYRKRREGGRVVSEYVGRGDVTTFCATLDAAERAERRLQHTQQVNAREQDEALDELLDAIGAALRSAAACELVAAGCHNHKGEWRVIRGGKA